MRRILHLLFVVLIVAVITNCALKEEYFPNCSDPATLEPESYPQGTELYYLSWVEHGSFGPKGESARRLLLMESKSELEKAEKIYRCQNRQVIKNMMALVVYDLAPEKYRSTAKKLLTEDDYVMQTDHEGSWVKTGEEFEGEDVDFYFDWGGEAAFRLLTHGTFTKLGSEKTLYRLYLSQATRNKALEVLGMFDQLPSVDLSNSPKTAAEYPHELIDDPFWNQQIEILKKWFEQNENRIFWDASSRRYRLIS